MIRYLAVRLAWSVAILFGLSLLFFVLEQVTPNGACGSLPSYTPGQARAVAACARRFGLDQPLPVQYIHVMANYLQGDTGPSASTQSLGALLAGSRPFDVPLLLGAIMVQVPVAVALGSAAALWPRSWFSRLFTPLAVVGRSVPPFWLAVMFMFLPILNVPWGLVTFDLAGRQVGPLPRFWSHAWFATLAHHPGPILAETLPPLVKTIIVVVAAGTLASAFVVRDALSTELHKAYVVVGRGGGLSRGAVFRRVLRAGLPAAMAGLAGRFGAMLGAMAVAGYILHVWGGSSWTFIFYAAGAGQDPAVGQGLFIVVTLLALAGSLLSGILQGMLDPRLRDGAAWVPPEAEVASLRPARSVLSRPCLLASAGLLGLLCCIAVLAPLLSPESFTGYDYTRMLAHPGLAWPWQHGWRYLLGADAAGRSMLMWVMYGARLPLAVGLVATLVAACLGLLVGSLGALPGAVGAWGDLLARWASAVLTTPPLILLVFMLTVYLAHGQWAIIALILGLVCWPGVARAVGAPAILPQQRRATLAARALGMAGPRLWWRGFRPLVGPLVNAALHVTALAIVLDAAMDFLGVGVSPTVTPTWGNAFVLSPSTFAGGCWWVPFFPGLCILLVSLSLIGVGEGLHRLLGSPRVGRERILARVSRIARARAHGDAIPPIAAPRDAFSRPGTPLKEGTIQ